MARARDVQSAIKQLIYGICRGTLAMPGNLILAGCLAGVTCVHQICGGATVQNRGSGMTSPGDEVRASIGDIFDVAREVAAIAAEFDERLGVTNSRVTGFLDGGWTGKAGSAYSEAFRLWHEGTDEARAGLADMAHALDDNACAYLQQDQTNAVNLTLPGNL